MNSLEKTEDKINFIIGMFRHFQPTLTIPEQIALLSLWEESFVSEEEYELAGAVVNELKKIKNDLNIKNTKEVKKPFYKRFLNWFKKSTQN